MTTCDFRVLSAVKNGQTLSLLRDRLQKVIC